MSATDHGTALVHPATGELLDLSDASTEQLAAAVVGLDDLRADLTDFEAAVSRELLQRMDRSASWTLRVGDPAGDRQIELTAPSPTAGTEGFDARLLEAELATLIERGTVDQDAAGRALARTLTVTVTVPFGHDVDELARAAEAVDEIAGVPVRDAKATAGRKVSLAGVRALRKVEGTGRALDRAMVRLGAPARRVKAKAVHR